MKRMVYAIALAVLVVGCSQKAVVEEPKIIVEEPKTDVIEKKDFVPEEINQLLNNVYFDFDKYDIRQDMYNVVLVNSKILNSDGSKFNVVVEGNCDEWGSEEYNQALGLKRAKAVKDALVSQGVYESRITIKSYGENNPVCNERSKDCDAKNRRAETKVQY